MLAAFITQRLLQAIHLSPNLRLTMERLPNENQALDRTACYPS